MFQYGMDLGISCLVATNIENLNSISHFIYFVKQSCFKLFGHNIKNVLKAEIPLPPLVLCY